jgi:hypothetical protein
MMGKAASRPGTETLLSTLWRTARHESFLTTTGIPFPVFQTPPADRSQGLDKLQPSSKCRSVTIDSRSAPCDREGRTLEMAEHYGRRCRKVTPTSAGAVPEIESPWTKQSCLRWQAGAGVDNKPMFRHRQVTEVAEDSIPGSVMDRNKPQRYQYV